MGSIRCVLAGNSSIVLTALTRLLNDEFSVLPSVLNKRALESAIKHFRPHVVVFDCDPRRLDKTLRPRIGIVSPEPAVIFLAGEGAGAIRLNCLDRDAPVSSFFAAIRKAAHDIRNSSGEDVLVSKESGIGHPPLSIREQQVLRAVALGKRMKDVAFELGITPRTVAFHKYKAMRENSIKDNYELHAFCTKYGLLEKA